MQVCAVAAVITGRCRTPGRFPSHTNSGRFAQIEWLSFAPIGAKNGLPKPNCGRCRDGASA
jgi:hypothetical protein